MSKYRLLDLSKKFDDVIELLKERNKTLNSTPNWVVWLLMAPFRDIVKINSFRNEFRKFISSGVLLSLPVISGFLGPIALINWSIPEYIQNIVGFLLGYLITLGFYFPKMLDFKSNHFHLVAYRTFRNQEFKLLSGGFLDDTGDFYFKGLYDQIDKSTDTYKLLDKRLNDYLHIERTELKNEIIVLKEKINQREAHFEEVINKTDIILEKTLESHDSALQYSAFLQRLLTCTSKVFSRMVYGRFSINDLNFLGGYLIYEYRKGDNYISLVKDVDTHSKSKDKIFLSENTGQTNLIRVKSKNGYGQYQIKLTNVSYVESSFIMDMDKDIQWIYSFHIDESDEYTLKMLSGNDMLNTIELHTLIHSICLKLYKEQKTTKGAASNGSPNSRGVSGA